MANTKDSSVNDEGSPRKGFTSASTAGTTKRDASSQDPQVESGFTQKTVETTTAGQDRPTAEQLRQQQQRDETQAFLDLQEQQRQAMAAQTKAAEEQQKKAAQREQNLRQSRQQQQSSNK